MASPPLKNVYAPVIINNHLKKMDTIFFTFFNHLATPTLGTPVLMHHSTSSVSPGIPSETLYLGLVRVMENSRRWLGLMPETLLCSCSISLLSSVNSDWCLAAQCEANQFSSGVMKSDINRFGLKGFLCCD